MRQSKNTLHMIICKKKPSRIFGMAQVTLDPQSHIFLFYCLLPLFSYFFSYFFVDFLWLPLLPEPPIAPQLTLFSAISVRRVSAFFSSPRVCSRREATSFRCISLASCTRVPLV